MRCSLLFHFHPGLTISNPGGKQPSPVPFQFLPAIQNCIDLVNPSRHNKTVNNGGSEMTVELEIGNPSQDGFDLDALLEESVDLSKKERQMKASRKAGAKGMPQIKPQAAWMTGPEMEQHYKDVAKIKQNSEGWVDLAAVLLIHSQVCTTCYAEHQRFEGVFVKKEHKRLKAVNYLIPKAVLEYAHLPREIEIRLSRTHICPACRDTQGWGEAVINIKE